MDRKKRMRAALDSLFSNTEEESRSSTPDNKSDKQSVADKVESKPKARAPKSKESSQKHTFSAGSVHTSDVKQQVAAEEKIDSQMTAPETVVEAKTEVEPLKTVSEPEIRTPEVQVKQISEKPSPKLEPKQVEKVEQEVKPQISITPQKEQPKTLAPVGDASTKKAEINIVVFKLVDEYYSIDINDVETIIKMQAITVVPHTATHVLGVTNLRGIVLPVFDLRRRFGLPDVEPTKDTRIIVVKVNNNMVGIVVDVVVEVIRVSQEKIEITPSIATTVNSHYVDGVINMDDRLVILLNLAKILEISAKI
jgi:purine-binding chemotaxis protein CheW